VGGRPARVLRPRLLDAAARPAPAPAVSVQDGRIVAHCGGGGTLDVLALEIDGAAVAPAALAARLGTGAATLGTDAQ
jgi:hypothetical protein